MAIKKIFNVKELKETYPLYPIVRKEKEGRMIKFKTLVRKRYAGKYYLIPMEASAINEAKAIHSIHVSAHKYLMLGELEMMDVEDTDQIEEKQRLIKNK